MRNITKTIIGLLNELDTTLQQQTEEPPNASKRQIMALQKAIILWFQSRQKPAPVKVTGVFDNKTLTIYKYFEKKGSVGIDGVRRKLKQLINKNLKTPKASPDTSPAVSEKHIQYVKNKAKNIILINSHPTIKKKWAVI